jgi:hypothetical protein
MAYSEAQEAAASEAQVALLKEITRLTGQIENEGGFSSDQAGKLAGLARSYALVVGTLNSV